jgi:single-strand DNA-binding protein
MPNVNKVILMGVLGRDPENKTFPNGGSITTFSMATSEFGKTRPPIALMFYAYF